MTKMTLTLTNDVAEQMKMSAMSNGQDAQQFVIAALETYMILSTYVREKKKLYFRKDDGTEVEVVIPSLRLQ